MFNRVSKVPVMWKVAGVRLGGVSQIAMLLTISAGVALVLAQSPWWALAVFATGALAIILASRTLRSLDPDETMSDITAFGVLFRALRHRHSRNYDASDN